MAVSMRRLYGLAADKYKMKLLAGESGLDRLASWVHQLESVDAVHFLRGQEIVFTTGVMNKDPEWLLDFAKKLSAQRASALVVNVGPYTKAVPRQVADYCNQAALPLFKIPWEIHLVDVTRDFCERIIQNSDQEASLACAIKNILFLDVDLRTQAQVLELNGCRADDTFIFLCLSVDADANMGEKQSKQPKTYTAQNVYDQVILLAEQEAKSIKEHFIHFAYERQEIFALNDYSDEELNQLINALTDKLQQSGLFNQVRIGVSDRIRGLENLRQAFKHACKTCTLAASKKSSLLCYNELDIYKLLMGVEDRQVILNYYEDTLGKLVRYDKENGTQMMRFLEAYLESCGSAQAISQKLFIHRNTVTNYVRRIGRILDMDLTNAGCRTRLHVAFLIRDLM